MCKLCALRVAVSSRIKPAHHVRDRQLRCASRPGPRMRPRVLAVGREQPQAAPGALAVAAVLAGRLHATRLVPPPGVIMTFSCDLLTRTSSLYRALQYWLHSAALSCQAKVLHIVNLGSIKTRYIGFESYERRHDVDKCMCFQGDFCNLLGCKPQNPQECCDSFLAELPKNVLLLY